MLKKNTKRIIYFILVLIWMMIIFMFSSENGEKSSNTSSKVTGTIVDIFTSEEKMTEEEREELTKDVDFVVRKLAHFTLYAIGGILIINYINTYNLTLKNKIILSILVGVIYAASDEIHQYFVAERGAKITDVLIDSLGIFTGIKIYNLFYKNILKKKNNNVIIQINGKGGMV